MPETLRNMRAAGLLGREIDRVTCMMRDPEWTGAVIVATPEDLAIEESAELLPRVTRALGRPPVAAFVNRAVGHLMHSLAEDAAALRPLAACLSPPSREALATLLHELSGRVRGEARLADLFSGRTDRGVVVLEDLLLARGTTAPRAVIEALRSSAAACL